MTCLTSLTPVPRCPKTVPLLIPVQKKIKPSQARAHYSAINQFNSNDE
uniref:Uncharacterized protein n=1 Tax=Arundo donax TaxID=35708 RepID=A0A0A9AIQ0_ARUDO